MKLLKHVGEGYHGTLPEGEKGTLFAEKDQVVEVSDAKAAQLLADFPKEWEEVVAKVADKDEAGTEVSKGKGKK